jgi:type IV secretory pathway TrbD component
LAKQKSATSLASIFRIALISGAFVGFVVWGAVREWNRVFIFAGSTVVVVFLGFIILNWLAKPDPDIKPGSPRL